VTLTTESAPIPAFDDEVGDGRKLCIICSKGSLDMAYPGLVLANAYRPSSCDQDSRMWSQTQGSRPHPVWS
jgi:hypothetical protein